MQANLFRVALALEIFALTGLLRTANAQNAYFPNSVTIDYTVPNLMDIVGYASDNEFDNKTNGTSPTLDVVSGASVNYFMQVYNNSTVNFHGGSIFSLTALDSSVINVFGGDSDDEFRPFNQSTLNILGGNLRGGVNAFNDSTVSVSGGSISDLSAFGNTTVNITGGNIVNGLYARESGLINLFGTGLKDTLINSNYTNPFGYTFKQYALSGRLADGTDLSGKSIFIENHSLASFTLTSVPEPGGIALLIGLVPGILLLHRRRK